MWILQGIKCAATPLHSVRVFLKIIGLKRTVCRWKLVYFSVMTSDEVLWMHNIDAICTSRVIRCKKEPKIMFCLVSAFTIRVQDDKLSKKNKRTGRKKSSISVRMSFQKICKFTLKLFLLPFYTYHTCIKQNERIFKVYLSEWLQIGSLSLVI